jgi:hypothetical protein
MSTRSMIAKKLPDGRFRAIYSHWDGYPSHNGRILLEHYSDSAKLDRLLDLGNISVLREEVGEKHDFDMKMLAGGEKWTTAYGRDRGDEDQEAKVFDTLAEVMPQDSWEASHQPRR